MATLDPTAATPSRDPLDLRVPRTIDELIADTLRIWVRVPAAFIATAALVVLPVELIGLGLLGGGFTDPDGDATSAAQAAVALLEWTILPALITATHASTLLALVRGERPSTVRALAMGGAVLVPALLATLLWTLLGVLGLLLIVLPGIYVFAAGVFAPVIAALGGSRPWAAFTASRRLVHAVGWWRTLGYLIVLGIVFGILVAIPVALLGVVVGAVFDGFGVGMVLFTALFAAVSMSINALVTTMLFFAWRARAGDAWHGPEIAPGAPLAQQGPAAPGPPA